MYKKIFFLTLLVFCCNATGLLAQVKYEKESRLKERKVPQEALSFVEKLNVSKKVKWYLEEGLNGYTIEAKFKRNGQQFSVEFDTLGSLQDAEIAIKSEDMDAALWQSITQSLALDCLKSKIIKSQVQYIGDSKLVFSKLNNPDKSLDITTNYEVIVKCKTGKEVDLYEYLYDGSGLVISRSKIVFKNSSHLEY